MVHLARLLAAVAALALAWAGAVRAARRPPRVAKAVLLSPEDHTTMNAAGAVRSVQAAELTLPASALEEIWSPMHLERLARTYWRFLTRCTLGLVRVAYDSDERAIVFLTRPFVLMRFRAPEYWMDASRGIVRWRIASGVLVSRAGRDADGYLQIEVERFPAVEHDVGKLRVEVEVANFYPVLARAVARWFYTATQSRIHVIITHGFLRSLAKLDFAESVVGRYAAPIGIDEVPDPPREPRIVAA